MGRHWCEITHPGLGKYRKIYGSSYAEVNQRSAIIANKWDEEYQNKLAKEQLRQEREEIKKLIEEKEREATQLTHQANTEMSNAEMLFENYLRNRAPFDFNNLKLNESFSVIKPEEPRLPEKPELSMPRYKASLNLLDWLSTQRRNQKIEDANELYRTDLEAWQVLVKEKTDQFQQKMHQWKVDEKQFYDNQNHRDREIDKLEIEYNRLSPKAIEVFFKFSILNLTIPFVTHQNILTSFSATDRTLIVNYALPDINKLPVMKEYKYIKKSNEIRKIKITEKQLNLLYDKFVFSLILIIYCQLFFSDKSNVLNGIILNGYVIRLDRSTGKKKAICIASSMLLKKFFELLNLDQVDPEICLKNSNWRSQKNLHLFLPVQPFRIK